MSEKLYRMSKVCIDNAFHCLSDMELYQARYDTNMSKANFDIACFYVCRALKHVMQAVLQEYGVEYGTKGDILGLLNIIQDKTDFRFQIESEIKLVADTVESWEEEGRYGHITSSKQDLLSAISMFYDIDEEFQKELSRRTK